jgi:NAD-dependent dihydropyrimidine dehydrogenase PreA subunit
MKIKTLAIVLLVLTFSCDFYQVGATKIEGTPGYCLWQKDKVGYRAFYSEKIPAGRNREHKKCQNLRQCIDYCRHNSILVNTEAAR